MRHCSHRSVGQWLRRDLSLTSGSTMARGMILRRVWRVAAAIISTNSGLSATARSCETSRLDRLVCSQLLNEWLRECLEVEGKGALPPLPDIDEMPGDRGGGCHGWRDEGGAALESLATLEIAVRGRGAALFRQQLVGIHRQAHRAARLRRFESGLSENL